ncbi:Flp family type IVb pilin [Blastochloris viridis]|uniref:Flp pilus assembly protein, pilin Flp n=1 Tax=Blastochloris viridis TaxID=1079 RepID=A0A0P0JGB9_BLAVI|nr:Flp family type IVb pilin [Blastochloris viridis]ALK08105.1 Flp/Fap pilin component [Blastochloris viridis]CUU44027.1 Flp pilus assembly protein, pilin Flp [Blastochloris viridis]
MQRFHKAVAAIRRISVDDRGVTAVEYAIVLAVVSLMIVAPLATIGRDILPDILGRVADVFRP